MCQGERYRHEDRADRQEGNERMKVRHEDREGKTGRMIGSRMEGKKVVREVSRLLLP